MTTKPLFCAGDRVSVRTTVGVFCDGIVALVNPRQSAAQTYVIQFDDGSRSTWPEHRVFRLLEAEAEPKPYEQRRKEALAELVGDYEEEHGIITEDEILRLDSEWLT